MFWVRAQYSPFIPTKDKLCVVIFNKIPSKALPEIIIPFDKRTFIFDKPLFMYAVLSSSF